MVIWNLRKGGLLCGSPGAPRLAVMATHQLPTPPPLLFCSRVFWKPFKLQSHICFKNKELTSVKTCHPAQNCPIRDVRTSLSWPLITRNFKFYLGFSMTRSQLQLQWASKANRNICQSYDETETNCCSFWEAALAPHTYVRWCLDSSLGLVIFIIPKLWNGRNT